MTLDFGVLFESGEHDYEGYPFLVDHSPEIFDCCVQGPLRRDKQLVIPLNRRIDVVCIDVRVVNVFISLDQSDPSVLDFKQRETDQTKLRCKKI